MLIKGARASSAYAFTAGDILYISATEGTITSTAPTGSSQFVRIVGYALNSTTIMVNPSQDWIELS